MLQFPILFETIIETNPGVFTIGFATITDLFVLLNIFAVCVPKVTFVINCRLFPNIVTSILSETGHDAGSIELIVGNTLRICKSFCYRICSTRYNHIYCS